MDIYINAYQMKVQANLYSTNPRNSSAVLKTVEIKYLIWFLIII